LFLNIRGYAWQQLCNWVFCPSPGH
jgi:hypothetical protein